MSRIKKQIEKARMNPLSRDSPKSLSARSSRRKMNLIRVRLALGGLFLMTPGSPISRYLPGWCEARRRYKALTNPNQTKTETRRIPAKIQRNAGMSMEPPSDRAGLALAGLCLGFLGCDALYHASKGLRTFVRAQLARELYKRFGLLRWRHAWLFFGSHVESLCHV